MIIVIILMWLCCINAVQTQISATLYWKLMEWSRGYHGGEGEAIYGVAKAQDGL